MSIKSNNFYCLLPRKWLIQARFNARISSSKANYAYSKSMNLPILITTSVVFILLLLTSNAQAFINGQMFNTLTMGPVIRETYDWQDTSYYMVAFRLDPREVGIDNVVRIHIASMWITTELNDSGHDGDPRASDTIWWHWQAYDFKDYVFVDQFAIHVWDADSNIYTAVHGLNFPNPHMDIPANLHPREDEIIEDDTVRFSWGSVERAGFYNFYLWNRQPDIVNFTEGLCYFQEVIVDTGITLPQQIIGQGGTYYWMLMAASDIRAGGGSIELASFEYQPQAVFEPDFNASSNANFYVYPNPSSSGSPIYLFYSGIPQSYTIYDINGRIVRHFSNDLNQKSSITQLTLRQQNLAHGIYFVKITLDKSSDARNAPILRFIVQ